MKSFQKKLLQFGAIQTMLMAIYHFFLPYQFQWKSYLSEDIPTINWALFALNDYFSFLLLLLSGTVLYYLRIKQGEKQTIQILAYLLLLFWAFSGIYQAIRPMPVPQNLAFLSLLLPGIALFNSLVFGFFLWINRKD